jgi:hypothetical protein
MILAALSFPYIIFYEIVFLLFWFPKNYFLLSFFNFNKPVLTINLISAVLHNLQESRTATLNVEELL